MDLPLRVGLDSPVQILFDLLYGLALLLVAEMFALVLTLSYALTWVVTRIVDCHCSLQLCSTLERMTSATPTDSVRADLCYGGSDQRD